MLARRPPSCLLSLAAVTIFTLLLVVTGTRGRIPARTPLGVARVSRGGPSRAAHTRCEQLKSHPGPPRGLGCLHPTPQRRTRMKVHANAALGPAGRHALVEAIESGDDVEGGGRRPQRRTRDRASLVAPSPNGQRRGAARGQLALRPLLTPTSPATPPLEHPGRADPEGATRDRPRPRALGRDLPPRSLDDLEGASPSWSLPPAALTPPELSPLRVVAPRGAAARRHGPARPLRAPRSSDDRRSPAPQSWRRQGLPARLRRRSLPLRLRRAARRPASRDRGRLHAPGDRAFQGAWTRSPGGGDERQRQSLSLPCLSGRARAGRRSPNPHPALHATLERQGRALHSDPEARVGLRPLLAELRPPKSRAGILPSLLQPAKAPQLTR